ncbi:MAG: outer membrane protein transport protein [Alphaproteobacteria bacterium]|nr:outer membrane protein transport protein [Alphaproteobacteria bacterium]
MPYRTIPSVSLRARLLGTSAVIALAASLNVAPSTDADAAGFALKEQSSAAQGNSFAGATAGAEDVTYMFFNPAGLTRHEGNQVAGVLTYIVPKGESNNADGNGVSAAPPSTGDAAEDAFTGAAYGMWSLSPDLKLAIAVNVPFGLSTKYDRGWQGRLYAIESSVQSVNVNPTIAYRINETVSIGFGLQAQKTNVTLSSEVGAGNLFEVEGDDWGYGFNLGALFELSPQTRIGVAYRSQVKHEISGDATLEAVGTAGAKADLTTPDSATLGIYHDINEQWAVMGEVAWTGWSTFDQVQINMDSDPGLGTTTVTIPQDWSDVWFAAIGASWRPNDTWTLRGGIAYDQTPLSNTYRSPRLTDEDRTWVSLGARYEVTPNFAIDAGYTHIFIKDANVDITLPPALTFTATYENSVDIITAQATWRF